MNWTVAVSGTLSNLPSALTYTVLACAVTVGGFCAAAESAKPKSREESSVRFMRSSWVLHDRTRPCPLLALSRYGDGPVEADFQLCSLLQFEIAIGQDARATAQRATGGCADRCAMSATGGCTRRRTDGSSDDGAFHDAHLVDLSF